MRNTDYSTKWISKFEDLFKRTTGSQHVLAVNSGTSALHLALRVLGVSQGDEIICPTFTFIGTINPVMYCGATPVFVDSEKESWNIDPGLLAETIRDRIRKGKKPKAIIVVHIFGTPARMDEIISTAQEFEIPVIEDAAQALGSLYDNKMVGGMGDLGIISFNNNKIITTLGGGILILRNPEWRSLASKLSVQAKSEAPYYEHFDTGYNYQMNGWGALNGIRELPSLNNRVQKKREIFNRYFETLSHFPNVTFQLESDEIRSNRWITAISMEGGINMKVKERIEQLGFEIKFLWNPMHLQPILSKYPYYGDGFAERLFNTGICLPSSLSMTRRDQEKVLDIMCENLQEKQCNDF